MLLPAALMGVDVDALLAGAQAGAEACLGVGEANPGLWLGTVAGELASVGRDKLTSVLAPAVASFGLWAEQIIAESCGTRGKGIVPIADEPFAAPEAYGHDRVIAYLRTTDEPLEEFDEEVQRLADAGQPTLTLPTHGAADLGRLLFVWSSAVAVAAWAIGVNPFDRPDVQEAADATRQVLEFGTAPQLPQGRRRAWGRSWRGPGRPATWQFSASCRRRLASTRRSPSCGPSSSARRRDPGSRIFLRHAAGRAGSWRPRGPSRARDPGDKGRTRRRRRHGCAGAHRARLRVAERSGAMTVGFGRVTRGACHVRACRRRASRNRRCGVNPSGARRPSVSLSRRSNGTA